MATPCASRFPKISHGDALSEPVYKGIILETTAKQATNKNGQGTGWQHDGRGVGTYASKKN